MSYTPKILLFDIENSPALGHFFGKVYETNILSVKEQSYILCVSYSWWPNPKIYTLSLRQYKGYKKGDDCEEKMLEDVWKLLDQADIVGGQNSDSFDIKHLNTRFAYHRMVPPSPYKTVDTLKKLRQAFNLPSNKLDFVCKYFDIGGKIPNTGKDLWLGVMLGDRKSWEQMERYNANDVLLLQKLYKLLLPWGKQPNLNLLVDRMSCSACGGKQLIRKGQESTYGRIYQRLRCLDCGKNNRDYGEKRESPINVRPL